MIVKTRPYALILLVVSAAPLLATPLQHRLEKAIEDSDTVLVERLIEELSKESPKDAQQILATVAPMAADVLSQRKAEKSILTDSADFTQALLGSLVGSWSVAWFIGSGYETYLHYQRNRTLLGRDTAEYIRLGASIVATFLSGYYAYKGFTCSSQCADIGRAHEIKKLFKRDLAAK